MLQLLVPVAVPDDPVEFVHVTAAIPEPSRAVPLTVIEAAGVETVLSSGVTMVRLGGAVLLPAEGA